MWQYVSTQELYHYGVPGMKWGVRKQAQGYRWRARSAYSASSRMINEKRRRAMMDRGRKYDEIADKLERGDEKTIEAVRKEQVASGKRACDLIIAGSLGAVAATALMYKGGTHLINKAYSKGGN